MENPCFDRGMKHRPARSRPSAPASRVSAPPRLILDLYGIHAVREAILNPLRVIRGVYATEDQAGEVDSWVRVAIKSGLKRSGVMMPPKAAFDAACGRDAVHQGVGVACDPLPETDLEDVLRGLAADIPACVVILDQVTDPHNMGAIIRSACAFGAAALVVQRRHAPELNALIAKIACGAVEHVPVCYETNLSRSIEVLKDSGFTVAGLDERGDVDLPDFIPARRQVIVLGAEGPGLRRLVREGCDHLVRLPTQEPIASLNVSNAAAVALYHMTQKNLK